MRVGGMMRLYYSCVTVCLYNIIILFQSLSLSLSHPLSKKPILIYFSVNKPKHGPENLDVSVGKVFLQNFSVVRALDGGYKNREDILIYRD